jgi:hypothetical protein
MNRRVLFQAPRDKPPDLARLDIIERAVRREITSDHAAELLMKQRRMAPRKPLWMPGVVYEFLTGRSPAYMAPEQTSDFARDRPIRPPAVDRPPPRST